MVFLPLCWLHVCLCILWKQKKYFSYLQIYCSMVISKQHCHVNRQFFLFKNCSLLAFFFTWLTTTRRGFTAAWFVTRSRKYVDLPMRTMFAFWDTFTFIWLFLFVCFCKENLHLWPLTLANPCCRDMQMETSYIQVLI